MSIHQILLHPFDSEVGSDIETIRLYLGNFTEK